MCNDIWTVVSFLMVLYWYSKRNEAANLCFRWRFFSVQTEFDNKTSYATSDTNQLNKFIVYQNKC